MAPFTSWVPHYKTDFFFKKRRDESKLISVLINNIAPQVLSIELNLYWTQNIALMAVTDKVLMW